MARMGVECTFVDPNCTDEELEAAFRPNTKCVFGETIANPALTVLDIERFAAAAHAHGVPLIVDNTFPTPVLCRPCTDEELEAAFRPNTKCVFGETIANPALTVLDIERFAAAAHAHGVPLIVDNTFPTPVLCRPIEWGADIVTHSTTKYMDGHGASVGGAIVDSGRFDWAAHAEKFPGLCEPDESYHGVVYVERFGLEGAYITKATAQLMRDLGSIQAPQNAFLVNVGLESLHLRMAQHAANGLAVAEHLAQHPKVAWVRYPKLEGDSEFERAQKYLPHGACGVVSLPSTWRSIRRWPGCVTPNSRAIPSSSARRSTCRMVRAAW